MTGIETPTSESLREMLDEIYPGPPARQPHHRAPCAANNTRMHRVLSWLDRYETNRKMAGNLGEEQFLCLWVSLNAAYGNNDFVSETKRTDGPTQFRKLLENILKFCEIDAASMCRLVCAIEMCRDEIIALAGTPFLYKEFWSAEQYVNQEKYDAWVKADEQDKKHRKMQSEIQKRINALLSESMRPAKKEYVRYVLNQTFERLNMLRNQVMHGSSEYEGKYNRSSLAPGLAVLRACLPEILHIMLTAMRQNPDDNRWGRVAYPPYLETPNSKEDPPRNN